VKITPPFIVSIPPDCCFYRTVEEADAAARDLDADVYDAHGVRLASTRDGLQVTSVEPDVLANVLRRWLGLADALGESTASWPLWLLVHAAVDHPDYEEQ
jgi:hypothetical protein